jgi:hypothetical protein
MLGGLPIFGGTLGGSLANPTGLAELGELAAEVRDQVLVKRSDGDADCVEYGNSCAGRASLEANNQEDTDKDEDLNAEH